MTIQVVLNNTRSVNDAAGARLADELTALFESHSVNYHWEVEECIDDSGDWLVGYLTREPGEPEISLYVRGDADYMVAYVDSDDGTEWIENIYTNEALVDVVNAQFSNNAKLLTEE